MFPGRAKQLVMDFIKKNETECKSPPTKMDDLGEYCYRRNTTELMDTCADCVGSRLQRYYFKTTTTKKVEVLITLVSSCSVHCMYC